MSDWQHETLDQWIRYFSTTLLTTENPHHELRKFFLEFEREAYNRALFDVIRTLDGLPDTTFMRSKIISMRLSRVERPASMPDIANTQTSTSTKKNLDKKHKK